MSNADWADRGNKVFIGTYNRFPAAMVRGRGCRLWDADGREYLDFLAGIAVCSLGHCHPQVSAAISRQAQTLVHVSNLFHTRPQIELAEMLVANSFADRVFMCNSGAEANEAAIKLARIHSGPGRYEVISLLGSFHGRTLAAVAATGQPKFHQGFEPLPQGFVHAEFGDPAAIERLIRPEPAPCSVSRCRAKAASGRWTRTTCGRSAHSAIATACCSSSTRCRPAWAAPAPCSPTNSWA